MCDIVTVSSEEGLMPGVKGEMSGNCVVVRASIQRWVKTQGLIARVDGRSFFDGSSACVH